MLGKQGCRGGCRFQNSYLPQAPYLNRRLRAAQARHHLSAALKRDREATEAQRALVLAGQLSFSRSLPPDSEEKFR